MLIGSPVVSLETYYEEYDTVYDLKRCPYVRVRISNPYKKLYKLLGSIKVCNSVSLKVLTEYTVSDSLLPNSVYKLDIPIYVYYDVPNVIINCSAYFFETFSLEILNIATLCESTKSFKTSAVLSLKKDTPYAILKAFCNLPGDSFKDTYVYWEHSSDGISWDEYDLESSKSVDADAVSFKLCKVPLETAHVDNSLEENVTEPVYVTRRVWKLSAHSVLDDFSLRPDAVIIPATRGLDNTLYRMCMCTIKDLPTDSPEHTEDVLYTEDLSLGKSVYTPVYASNPEILVSSIANASKSTSTYFGNVVYGYDNPYFKNNIIPTSTGESTRPLSKIIPLDTAGNAYCTAILSWKDYLIAFTAKSIHLVSKIPDGYSTKSVNSFIGIPDRDNKCCISTLNGAIFKSDSKIYLVYPNVYAGENSVLNITELSTPVESILEEFDGVVNSPFAIGTSSLYILMLPHTQGTYCLQYSYNNKRWTVHNYPVVFDSFEILNLSDIRLFGYYLNSGAKIYGEYRYNVDLSDVYDNVPTYCVCADCLTPTPNFTDWQSMVGNDLRPIPFELDSGQKTDSMNFDKQFVESKFNVVTLHENDTFPMDVTVQIDGNPFVTKMDINTDSAFWKTSLLHKGVLSTDFASEHADLFNVFRQMYLRHSGKGRSIRYIIEGESMYPFKIYEIDYRYRNLNVKH